MESDSLTYQSFKNASYGILSFVFPILLSIAATPIMVKKLGVTDYGIYILANTIIGVLGLLDLGLTSALIKYISQYYSQRDEKNIKKVSHACNTLYLLVGIFGFFIFLFLGKFFLPMFKITGASQGHILIVFIFAGAFFLINSANSVYTTIPSALQRFDIVSKINLAQLFIFTFVSLVLLFFGLKLKAIMLVNFLIMLAASLVYYIQARKLLPFLGFKFSWDVSEFKKLYSFGFYASMASLGLGSLNQIDRLIIPIFLGPIQLSYYSLPGNVAQKTSMVTSNIAGIWLFPLASSLLGKGEVERLGIIHRKIMRNLTLLAAAISISIMFFGNKILFFWLGASVAEKGTVVLLILAPTYFILSLFGPMFYLLMGLGKQKILSVWTLSFALINLFLLFPLVKFYGITGAAWAYFLSTLPIFYMLYWLEKKVFRLDGFFKFYFNLYTRIFIITGVFYVLVKYVIIGRVNNIISLIFIGPLSVLLFLALYKLFGFVDQEDWQLFVYYLRQVRARIFGSPV